MIGINSETKILIDKYYKQKGFSTRASYIKSLVEMNIANHPEIQNVNPELIN